MMQAIFAKHMRMPEGDVRVICDVDGHITAIAVDDPADFRPNPLDLRL
jgi:hypothetical protein